MTPIISAILTLLVLMTSMDFMAEADVTMPSLADSLALRDTMSARRALSAFCLTVLVISSMDAAVSSSELACSCADEESWPAGRRRERGAGGNTEARP